MSGSTHVQRPNGQIDELRLVTKGIVFLALLTGIVYLRVFIAEGLVAFRGDGLDLGTISVIVLLAVATAALLATWRWEGLGGAVSAASGLVIGILVYFISDEEKLFQAFAYGSPFIISGGFSLACSWQRRKGLFSRDS